MPQLINKPPKRFFAFGCSFTNYNWSTWADIVAEELKVPYYNYGRGGAGNQYIFNTIMQADALYNFNEDDLVMICWTNIAREDRYTKGGWITPGNIFTQSQYDADFIKKWVEPTGCAIRDFAFIKSITDFLELKNIPHHQMKMMDFDIIDQWVPTSKLENEQWISNLLVDMYQPVLNKIHESFYKVLWNNDVNFKLDTDRKLIGNLFCDGHPFPYEALTYLQHLFNHQFANETISAVLATNTAVVQLLKSTYISYGPKKRFYFPQDTECQLCKVATSYIQSKGGCT